MTATVCRQCSADTALKFLDRIEGEDSGIHIVIEGLPALDCVNGHTRFPSPEFPLEFIQRVLGTEGLITAEPAVEKGFFRKRAHCPGCGAELPEEAPEKSKHEAKVQVPEAETVGVELAIPLYRCGKCNQEITLPKTHVERGVMKACANAFEGAKIPPG